MAADHMLASSPLLQICTCRFRLALVLKGQHSFLITSESFYLIILGVKRSFCNCLYFVFVLFGFIHFLPVDEIKKIGFQSILYI